MVLLKIATLLSSSGPTGNFQVVFAVDKSHLNRHISNQNTYLKKVTVNKCITKLIKIHF